LTKIESIQEYYQLIEHSLNNICIKEKDAIAVRFTFKEVVLSVAKEEVVRFNIFSLSEQT
jgi:hypothetical protein